MIFRHLACLCRELKDYDQAYQYINRGLKIDPFCHEFLMEKMYIKDEQEDYQGVLKVCEEIDALALESYRRIYPDDLRSLWIHRGDAHRSLGNFTEALRCQDELSRQFPEDRKLFEARKIIFKRMAEAP